jgi:hypothetical protein
VADKRANMIAPKIAAGGRKSLSPLGIAPRPDPIPYLAAAAAAAAQSGQPAVALTALDKALDGAFGHRLFTMLVVDLENNQNRRFYSSRPDEYPVGRVKPILCDGIIARRVIVAGECHINRNYDELKNVFADHELIRSLGCEGSINVPVRWNGRTLGTLNLLHEADWFSEADIPVLTAFSAIAIPIVEHFCRELQGDSS